jgi:hypothetical protein
LAPTGLAHQDAISIILASPLEDEQVSQLESKVTGCVQDALGQISSDIRITPADDIRKVALEVESAGKTPPPYLSLERLVADPALHGRIASLGLRYLIAVYIEDTSRLRDVEVGAGSSGIGGPRVSWSWSREVLMEAVVVDTRHRRVAGSVLAYARGRSGGGVMLLTSRLPLLIPFGMTSFPLSVACQGLGEALAKFLIGGSPTEEQVSK